LSIKVTGYGYWLKQENRRERNSQLVWELKGFGTWLKAWDCARFPRELPIFSQNGGIPRMNLWETPPINMKQYRSLF
jgi:type II secretory pathway component PulF